MGGSTGSVQRELQSLSRAGILAAETIGIQKFFRANRDHPIFNELRAIAVKTFGLADVLRDAFRPVTDKIAVSFIFGSVATGQETGKSDIDLLIVGKIGLKELATVLEPFEQSLGRPINPTLFSRREFGTRLINGDHFVKTLQDSEKLFIVGTSDDLRRLAQK